MKILICGATGLIGTELVALCLKKNHSIHYLTTRKEKIETSENYKGFYWNPEKGEIDTNCFEGVEVIINLSGASIAKRWTKAYKEEVINSRTTTATLLHTSVQSLSNHSIKQYISASGIGIYKSSLTEYYTEEAVEKDNGFLGKVVMAWEAQAAKFSELNIKVGIVRIGLVLAKKGGALVEMAKPIKYGVGSAVGSGKQWQSWIHVTDIARLFMHVLEHTLEGVYNGVAPNPVTNKALTKEIAKKLKRPLFMPNVPETLLKTILGEMYVLLISSQHVSSEKIQAAGFTYTYPELEAALKNIFGK